MLNLEDRSVKEPLLIDRHLFEVWFDSQKIALTATEYDLLTLLNSEKYRVLSRSELIARVWGEGNPGMRVVDTYVSRLRTKLRVVGHPGVLSIRKRGYGLAGAVGRDE